MNKNILISVTALVHDNEQVIENYIIETIAVLRKEFYYFELILIDNGSQDSSIEKIQALLKQYENIRLLILSRKYELEVAERAAIENAIGDYVILMDILSDPPSLIPKLVKACEKGVDVAIGLSKVTPGGFINSITRKLYAVGKFFGNYAFLSDWSHYVCISRKTVNSMMQVKNRKKSLFYLNTEIGYKHATIFYTPIHRADKESSLNDIIHTLRDLEMIFVHSNKLLKYTSRLSLISGLFTLLYIVYIVLVNIFKRKVAEGWTSTSFVIAVTMGMVFIILGIIGEYLAYMYDQIQRGPLYHIAEEYNSGRFLVNDKKNVVK